MASYASRQLLICVSLIKSVWNPREQLVWLCFTPLLLPCPTSFPDVLPRGCLQLSTFRGKAERGQENGKKNRKTVKGIIFAAGGRPSDKLYSEKIIPAKKRNKPFSCAIIKEKHLYACLISHSVSCMLQKQYNRATYWNSASLFHFIYFICITEAA